MSIYFNLFSKPYRNRIHFDTVYCGDCPFPILCRWPLRHELTESIHVGFLLGSLFCSSGLRACFLCQKLSVLVTVAFWRSLKSGSEMPQLCSPFSRSFRPLWVLPWSVGMVGSFAFCFCEKCHLNLVEIAVNVYTALAGKCCFNNILPMHEHGIFFSIYLCLQFLYQCSAVFHMQAFHVLG